MAAPVADSLVSSVLQGLVTALNRHNGSTEHLHSLHVHMLSLHIESTHINRARHIHKGTCSSSCHAMLSSACLCDDTCLSHLLCHENLTERVVYLMRSRVVQVLALQIELTSVLLAHALCEVER